MKRLFVKASIGAAGLAALLVPLQGCTDLNETPPSLISTSNFFTNEAEGLAALAGVYGQLRSTTPEGSLYDVNVDTTGDGLVPLRGHGWHDHGQGIDFDHIARTPAQLDTREFFHNVWNNPHDGD